MDYHVRKAISADLTRILQIYSYARSFMANTGNPNQWGSTHPAQQMLEDDILRGDLFVLENKTGIHGVFAYLLEPDPTYTVIYDGQWRSNDPYGTIHRIAGDGSGGILGSCIDFCLKYRSYLRIDTHKDNHVMQAALHKQGFSPCGTILLENGDPRIAFDRLPK